MADDKPNYLSRAEMEQHLRENRSILWRGEVITDIAKLPSEADLVANDEERHKAALANMQERKKNLEAQIAKLEATPPAKALEPKPPEPPKGATPTPPATHAEAEHPDRPHRPAHVPEEQAPQHGQRKPK